MQRLESLYIVTRAVTAFTGSYGAPADRPKITQFFNDEPNPAHPGRKPTNSILFYVDGIRFGNFFAFSDQSFESAESALWASILDEARESYPILPSIAIPDPWTYRNTVGQIAGYLSYQIP